MAFLKSIGSLFASILRGLDFFRRGLHLLLLLVVFMFLIALLAPSEPPVPRAAALVLNPVGQLVEQLDGDAVTRALDEAAGQAVQQTLVRDVVRALEAAGDDERIKMLVLDLDRLGGSGLTKLQTIAEAITTFKKSGKRVLAYGDNFTQGQYYLAAHADEVYMHQSGFLFLQGFGRYRNYYRQAIDSLLVDWNVFRVGEFKSFVEPYLRDDMSVEDRRSSSHWLEQLWASFKDEVAVARGLEAEGLQRYSDEFLQIMQSESGDTAAMAVSQGLIDDLKSRNEFRERVSELLADTGAVDPDDPDEIESIGIDAYARSVNGLGAITGMGTDRVGVIFAVGDILNGVQPPGRIGGDSTAQLIRLARKDDNIKAVVLRVDSGGGSKFASEVIEAELRQLEEAGKPLIVSMGSVAASGGYWIALPGREIWASPDTLTGSIGIGAMFPTVDRSLDKLGLHTDGVGTTRWSGEFRPDRPMSEDAKQVLQTSIEHGYRQFIGTVALGRDLAVDVVDGIAGGRVWSGRDAHRLGLVDELGDLEDAIASAAKHARLDDYDVEYVDREPSLRESISMYFVGRALALAGKARSATQPAIAAPVTTLVQRLQDDLQRLASFNDPRHLYLHCFCEVN